jgi:hypothetical protein
MEMNFTNKNMKKVICFCLWGNDYRYIGGAFHNIELAKIYYPDWICRFYVGSSTNEETLKEMEEHSNVEVIRVNEEGNFISTLWRFLAAGDPDVEVMISRDTDSRLHHREKAAVEEWLNSDKQFHIMRDHQYHGVPILAGMFGAKRGILNDIKDMMDSYKMTNFMGIDQQFLAEKIYPMISGNSMVHDEFFERKSFPKDSKERHSAHFVGQAYSGDGSILDVPQYGIVYIQDYLKIDLKK